MSVISLQKFDSKKHSGWIADERRTARLIQYLWAHAKPSEHKRPDFLQLVVSLGWITKNMYGEIDNTTKWRNRRFADYLGILEFDSVSLGRAAASRWPSSNEAVWRKHLALSNHTGITNYYAAMRPLALAHIAKHADAIVAAMQIFQKPGDTERRIRKVMALVSPIATFKTSAGGKGSLLKAISPALACLDTQNRFPIMNDPTERLLRGIGHRYDADGAVALAKLIGTHGIKDNKDLDVYACTAKHPKPKKIGKKVVAKVKRLLGLKNENASIVSLAKKSYVMRKKHNKLVNRFRDAILWRFSQLDEGEYDILVRGWKKNRDLLIEAKTAWKGSTGRFQVRTAIGQLFDYRLRLTDMNPSSVDLAVLLPSKPSADIISLLESLEIETLWLKGSEVDGTVSLV